MKKIKVNILKFKLFYLKLLGKIKKIDKSIEFKQSRKKVSPAVLRAIARINDYKNRRANYLNVWNQKSTNYSSLTS